MRAGRLTSSFDQLPLRDFLYSDECLSRPVSNIPFWYCTTLVQTITKTLNFLFLTISVKPFPGFKKKNLFSATGKKNYVHFYIHKSSVFIYPCKSVSTVIWVCLDGICSFSVPKIWLKSYRAFSGGQQNYYFSFLVYSIKLKFVFPLLLFLDGYFSSFTENLIGSFTDSIVALHCIL